MPAKGPRGWQCPKCWKAGRILPTKAHPRLIVSKGCSVNPAPMIKVRYRVCELCGHNVVTEERLRCDVPKKPNKTTHRKR